MNLLVFGPINLLVSLDVTSERVIRQYSKISFFLFYEFCAAMKSHPTNCSHRRDEILDFEEQGKGVQSGQRLSILANT